MLWSARPAATLHARWNEKAFGQSFRTYLGDAVC